MSIERGKRYTDEQKRELLELFKRDGKSVSRFCRDNALSYGTLKRWLGPGQGEAIRFVELAEAGSGVGRLSVALPNGLWAEFPVDADKSVVANWIRELRAC